MGEDMIQSDFTASANVVTEFTHDLLKNWGVSESWINWVNLLIVLAAAVVIVFLLQKITRYVLTFIFRKAERITKLRFFKYAINNKLPNYLGLIVPYTFILSAIPTIFADFPKIISPCIKIADIYIVFIVIWTIMAIIKSFANVIQEKPAFQNKPLKSYLQVIQIILYIFGAVTIYSVLTGKSATAFFAAMGAASAILMLMFKDSIMGFVSSIQVSTNQMVMIGDWITMNKYGADGDVEEINLTTVKVRNFDKTITTIPTYALISDSFQNWRGMQTSGGRRIKRAITIKQSNIRMLTDAELDNFEKNSILATYIGDKRKQYAELNETLGLAPNALVRGYGISNCDLFMCYATWLLRNNPEINQNMTLMVRQLAPGTQGGIPIEIYAFTATIVWADYERIMTEIFNHLYSNMGLFGLSVFELTTGSDGYNVVLNNREDKDTHSFNNN